MGSTSPMLAATGSTMMAAISLRILLEKRFDGGGIVVGRDQRMLCRRFGGTPGLSGRPIVATPEPACTSSISA